MIERFYQPDYSCIFGKQFSNAFKYGNVDSLVWPIFTDIKKSDSLNKLLALKNAYDKHIFYTRKIALQDFRVELNCSDINTVLVQGMDLGRDYGISNIDVINVIKEAPNLFKGILSFSLNEDKSFQEIIEDIEETRDQVAIAGLALYPSHAKINLLRNNNISNILEYCLKNNLFIKLDLGNNFLPEFHPDYLNYDIIKSFVSKFPRNIFILSNLDISRDFELYYPLFKYHKNLWYEITPLSFGGLTPFTSFRLLYSIKGFIQNCWDRLTVGSTTPTLEISQMVKGFRESLTNLTFAQRCILKTWMFRNINRINQKIFKPISNKKDYPNSKVIKINKESILENDTEIQCLYKVKLRSYSITQLLFLTDLIKDLTQDTLKEYPDQRYGELFIRSYHTTTSLIINEHEYGNYLDLHFKFADISRKNSQDAFHTVSASENRPDFNRFDHDLATTYGNRQIIIPILNRELELGGRENLYILVTFGPRTFDIFIKIKLVKISNKNLIQ